MADESTVERLTLRVKRLDKGLPLPKYAYPGDAGLDLLSARDVTLEPSQRQLVPTGLAIALPDGWAGFVQPRSGLATRQGLSIVNTPGLVDAQYRGELKVNLINLDPSETIHIHRGDRIAQLVVQRVPMVTLEEVEELDTTERGEHGFGSSGR